MNAETVMFLAGVSAFALTVHWVRSRRLREKYAIVWLGVALLLLVSGLFPDLIKGLAESLRLSYPAAVLLVALTLIYLFAFTVSVSLSRLHFRTLRLTQELALLDQRVRALEQTLAAGGQRPPEAAGERPPP